MSSAPPPNPKLTKKQKKGLAFRERKQGKQPGDKGKDRHGEDSDEAVLAVPVEENQDLAGVEVPGVEAARVADAAGGGAPAGGRAGKGKAAGEAGAAGGGKSGKRKREEGEAGEGDGEKPRPKKKKGVSGDGAEADAAAVSAVSAAKKKGADKSPGKQRFILFIGNLKYTTSEDAIKEHFAACDPPPTIRLLTPKPSAPGKPTAKSKGCAFLEFTHRNALQQALKLHQSEIEGRRINVELTAGGGGRGEGRITKVQERNKKLDTQRKDHQEKQEKLAKYAKGEAPSVLPERPQRFSTTSGLEQGAAGKRTWAVGDVEDDGETHRGGVKHTKAGKTGRVAAKVWGTGVNAIPVG